MVGLQQQDDLVHRQLVVATSRGQRLLRGGHVPVSPASPVTGQGRSSLPRPERLCGQRDLVLLETAEVSRADAVVIGRRGRGLSRRLLGSVARFCTGSGVPTAAHRDDELRERPSPPYFSRLRAMTMRWTWLVPS
ncbi:universal stress protein [Blastococcus sp. PRF04-17]|uniref:universal stress protein n=1 Tax=Blastococcus sp. PRF04-17 TaxID=2933797 RepID=UPI00353012DF